MNEIKTKTENQAMLHSILPRALLFNLAHKQRNGITVLLKDGFSLKSESEFFPKFILMFGSA